LAHKLPSSSFNPSKTLLSDPEVINESEIFLARDAFFFEAGVGAAAPVDIHRKVLVSREGQRSDGTEIG
jgi:hypothetical protein